MHKTWIASAALAAAFFAFTSAPASADPAYISTSVNVRAGPGLEFPRIDGFGPGTAVNVYGCIDNRFWCDVSTRSTRGWVSSRYLDFNVGGQRGHFWENRDRIHVSTEAWNIDSYWNSHYRGRDFDRQREQFRHDGPPPPPSNTHPGNYTPPTQNHDNGHNDHYGTGNNNGYNNNNNNNNNNDNDSGANHGSGANNGSGNNGSNNGHDQNGAGTHNQTNANNTRDWRNDHCPAGQAPTDHGCQPQHH